MGWNTRIKNYGSKILTHPIKSEDKIDISDELDLFCHFIYISSMNLNPNIEKYSYFYLEIKDRAVIG